MIVTQTCGLECFIKFSSFQQEIMVGSQYQADIPSLSPYNEHEKGKLLT